jgi:hypothetical protein
LILVKSRLGITYVKVYSIQYLVFREREGQGTRDKVQETRDKGQETRDKGQGTRDKGQEYSVYSIKYTGV